MSVGATQWLAFAITAALGAGTSGYFDMHPLLGVLAMYVSVFPAMIIHFLCSLLESKESRWEAARLNRPIDFDAEARRIANAGYPEQHRLFLENKLQREQLRTVLQPQLPGNAHAVQSEERTARLEEQTRVGTAAANQWADRELKKQLAALEGREPAKRQQFDRVAVYAVAVMRYRREMGLSRSDEPEEVTPHHACSVCGERIPSCLANCWYCAAVVLAR